MLYADQMQALDDLQNFLSSDEKFYILSGPAGTGKTYVLGEFKKLCGDHRIYYTATTHPAVEVLNDFIHSTEDGDGLLNDLLFSEPEQKHQNLPKKSDCFNANIIDFFGKKDADPENAITIHSLLSLKIKNDYNTGQPVLVSSDRKTTLMTPALVVVDECSMVSKELLFHIENASNDLPGLKFLFVGDHYQIPPVGELESPVFIRGLPGVFLTEVKRQALDNPITVLATQFREGMRSGQRPYIKQQLNNGRGVRVVDRSQFDNLISRAFSSKNAASDRLFVKIIAWRNDTTIKYNQFVRLTAFDYRTTRPQIGETYIANNTISQDDEVKVKNGTKMVIEWVEDIEVSGIPAYMVHVDAYEDGQLLIAADPNQYKIQLSALADEAKHLSRQRDAVDRMSDDFRLLAGQTSKAWRKFYEFKETFCDLRPYYAITAHKAQGATFGVVFIDFADMQLNPNFNEMMRLMYVALTRATIEAIITW